LEGFFGQPALFLVGRIAGRLAFGEFDEEALAIHAGPAEAGQSLDEAHERLRVFLEGRSEGGGVEGGKELADTQSGDLLGGFVKFAIVLLLDKIEEEFNLDLGVFTTLLFGEPDEVTSLFPTGEVISIKTRTLGTEASEDVVISNAQAEHDVNFLANVRRQFGDFVAREFGDGREVAGLAGVWPR
jgi:hypothetical protein